MSEERVESTDRVTMDVGFILGLIFAPYIFAWITLKKGFPMYVRVLSFVWLGLIIFFVQVGF